MPKLMTCPRGHQWDPTAKGVRPNLCPVCGATVVQDRTQPVASGAVSTPPGSITEPHAATPARAVPPIAAVPGYEVLGVLGQGGMGVVYKARQVKLKRLVALKMIIAGAHASPQELARFRAEAEAVARLQHPNIVQIYEVGEQNGLPFFSLEFVDGGCLRQK